MAIHTSSPPITAVAAIIQSGAHQHLPSPLFPVAAHTVRSPDITACIGEQLRTHESRHDRRLMVVKFVEPESMSVTVGTTAMHPAVDEAKMHGWQQEGAEGDILPSYVARLGPNEAPPIYAEEKEDPMTLTQFLFFFGFIFFPLWIIGIMILFGSPKAATVAPTLRPICAVSGLTMPSSASQVWMLGKTEEEREMIVKELRGVELKWAYRCLWAMVGFVIAAIAFIVGAWWYLRD